MIRILMTAVTLTLLSCAANTPPRPLPPDEPQFLTSAATESLSLPFSEAVRVGDVLYLSGQVGNLPGTLDLAPGGIAGETRQTLENIEDILLRHGSGLDRVVKCTVFLADIDEWAEMNEVYKTYFPTRPPARSAMGANGLAIGARVEIECLAVAGARSGE
jgi:reactive intermediate/imine deaminase